MPELTNFRGTNGDKLELWCLVYVFRRLRSSEKQITASARDRVASRHWLQAGNGGECLIFDESF